MPLFDRLANEIDYIYKLNITKVDWGNIKKGETGVSSIFLIKQAILDKAKPIGFAFFNFP